MSLKNTKPFSECYDKVVKALAGLYLNNIGFGGIERTIHAITIPEHSNKLFEVYSKRIVKTGMYYPPEWYQDFEGNWEYNRGGLDNCKTHIVLDLSGHIQSKNRRFDGLWIEVKNVNLVK